jgi:23S rRNA pseudouridine1911/1915/1917 synthase
MLYALSVPIDPDNLEELELDDELSSSEESSDFPTSLTASPEDAGLRLDHFLVSHLPDVSRVRVQQMIEQGFIWMNGKQVKPSLKLKGGESMSITGRVQPEPLRAVPEEIPLDVVFEDKDLAVINKPAGMTVHAAHGAGDDPRNRGTLVNALVFRFKQLSEVGGELRPGIVHRLDKDTSGLIVVAKNDTSHRKLAEQFATRRISKRYVALVHGWPSKETGTINAPIQRDRRNPVRMTVQGDGGRDAVSHYKVTERLETPYGRFAMVEVKIDTGRTHQIRVHMSSIGHPVVGDTLYGAPEVLSPHTLARERAGNAISLRVAAKKARAAKGAPDSKGTLSLTRNFLHAAHIEFLHPRSAKRITLSADLPVELNEFLSRLQGDPTPPR